MTVERIRFATSEPTEDEMLDILRGRVQRVFGMTLDEFASARCLGNLPDAPGRAALEVFAGDYGLSARRDAPARA